MENQFTHLYCSNHSFLEDVLLASISVEVQLHVMVAATHHPLDTSIVGVQLPCPQLPSQPLTSFALAPSSVPPLLLACSSPTLFSVSVTSTPTGGDYQQSTCQILDMRFKLY